MARTDACYEVERVVLPDLAELCGAAAGAAASA